MERQRRFSNVERLSLETFSPYEQAMPREPFDLGELDCEQYQ